MCADFSPEVLPVGEKLVNKIIYGNTALIDLTADTISENDVLEGITFHKADGSKGTGAYIPVTSYENEIISRDISDSYTNSSVTSIGNSAFNTSYYLTSVDFPSVTSIGAYAFQNCSRLTSVNFPSVRQLGLYVFQSCSKLTSVDFPFVPIITYYAFGFCYKLTSVNFPSATTIDSYAFRACSKLTSVDFPSVTSIGTYAFYGCTTLTSVIIRTTSKVCTLSNKNAFTSTPIASGTGYIYVPDSLVSSYKSATNWSTYANQIKGLSELSGG